MNILKSGPTLLKVFAEAGKYNRLKPTFDKLRESGNIETEKALIQKASGEWAENTSRKIKVNYIIEGEENIPEKGPIMVYANHQGLADILAIVYVFRNHFQMGFIAKNEWRKLKPLADGIEYTRSIFLIRDNPRAALEAVSQAKELLDKGFSLTIYPEGTRSRCHTPGEFKPGAFKFAEKAKVPVLPISLDGSYKIFEETGDYKPGQTIKIKIHPLVHIENMDRKELKVAEAMIEKTIKEGIDW